MSRIVISFAKPEQHDVPCVGGPLNAPVADAGVPVSSTGDVDWELVDLKIYQ
ncbi:hypothetical protein FHS27_004898 [Rhodopirellula rubra]|uniref:Uncharacterized protein n=1 Tax=Aporhodopirellula rubra TaxID=980271 RepID=A0A7W5H6Y6_9BACT|nr:hypothetical protein [Aporhodopirellula rubra]